LGAAAKAVAVSREAIARNDRFAPAYYHLAVAHRMLGDLIQARSCYQQARSLGYPEDNEMETLGSN
jgi:Flp pilus assembly protein TadD